MAQSLDGCRNEELPTSPNFDCSSYPKSVFECFSCNSPEFPSNTHSRLHCTGCLLVAYCSEQCANDDADKHDSVCKEFPAVDGNSVLHSAKSWKKHIAGLRKRAARLPEEYMVSSPIFDNPRVCHTCHDAGFDNLTLCKCGCVCYCSEICAYDDKMHQKICKKLRKLKESNSLLYMRESYPESLFYAFDDVENFGPDQLSRHDLITLNIHIVTSTAYFDAVSWVYVFSRFPRLMELNLVFVLQGMAYNASYDKSERLTIDKPKCVYLEPENGVITYSVHQKPYHMFFSSPEYTEPDLVVCYGIPYKDNDINGEISYRNMTYCKHTLLVLMDSTEELVNKGIEAVNSVCPVKVVIPCELNLFRGFGSHRSEMIFDMYSTNEKCYIAGLCKDQSS